MLYQMCKIVLHLVCWPYFRIRSFGKENIPKTGGILFISNHASYLDPPLIGMHIPGKVYYMAKKELFDFSLFSWFLGKLNAIPIKRGGVDREALKRCRGILDQGNALLLFPEGTRTRDGDLGSVKPGAAMLVADLTQVAILPVYIHGTYRALPRGKWLPRPNKISIFFGIPFKIPQKGVAMDKKTYYKSISNRFQEALVRLKKNTDFSMNKIQKG